jgi:hypothetical protein
MVSIRFRTLWLLLLLLVSTGCKGSSPDASPAPMSERTTTAASALTGGSSSIASNFNGTSIGSGSTIWFTAAMKLQGLPHTKAHLYLTGSQITFSTSGTNYTVNVPDAVVTFDPNASQATTTYDTGAAQWETTLPLTWSGNALLSAVEMPVGTALSGGINPVTWSGNFASDTSGLTVQWAWSAAVYTSFSTTYGALGVKPVDDNHISQYPNSDLAGTPENEKSYLTGGARGGGGSNWTGSLSGTTSVTPTVSACDGGSCTAATPTPAIGSFAVYATDAILMDANSLVTGCNVGVESTTGPFLSGNVAAYFNGGAQIQTSQSLYAASVYLNSSATVGPVDTNEILGNSGASYGTVSPFPASMPAQLTMPSATAGTQSINLNSGTQTLAAGSYGSVLVGAGATLKLSGGNYVLSSLTLNGNATLAVSAASSLSITGNVNLGSGSYLGPASGSGLTAKSLVLYFDSSSNLNLNSGVTIQALVLATSALVNVDTSSFTGALAAAQVTMNSGSKITCQDGFGSLAGGSCPGGCDDGNACTTDACNSGTCTHTPIGNGTTCTGTNLCEQTYTCQSGVCTGSNPVTCSASDQCHVAGTCNPSTGQCSNPTATDGTSCSDGNECDLNDTCQAGVCTAGSNVTCTASDQCHTAGTCNPSTGQCSNPVATNGTSCSDGNACDLNDTCQAGVCTAGSHVSCSASDQCHVAGTCDPSTGQCSNPTATNGTACSDGNACDLNDTCQAGVCTAGSHISCSASDQCHVAGTCDPSTGQCSNPTATNGTACNDGNACDLNDTCQAGVCTAGGTVTCTASDACHVAGTCNPSTGQCSTQVAPNGTTCSDGNACDLNDTCQAGVCTAGSHVTCAPPAPTLAAGPSLPTAVAGATAAMFPFGDVLITGGVNASGTVLGNTQRYAVFNKSWFTYGSLLQPRYGHAAVALPNGEVIVVGGTGRTGQSVTTAELFSFSAGGWTATTSPEAPRASAQAVLLLNGNVLVVGIPDYGPFAEQYDPASATWTAAANGGDGGAYSPTGVGPGETLVLLGTGKVLVVGDGTTAASLYDPSTNTWSSAAPMPAARLYASGAALPTGQAIIAGGETSGGQVLQDAVLYDPVSNVWLSAGQMSVGRSQGAGATLPNGLFVLSGGGSSGVDVYNPFTGSWSSSTDTTVRTQPTATLTGSGAILITGGLDAGFNTLSSTELFTSFDAQCMPGACNPQTGTCEGMPRALLNFA